MSRCEIVNKQALLFAVYMKELYNSLTSFMFRCAHQGMGVSEEHLLKHID